MVLCYEGNEIARLLHIPLPFRPAASPIEKDINYGAYLMDNTI